MNHKTSFAPHNDLLLPIQAGAALNGHLPQMAAYDDSGDNISQKNRSYCEMTAIYWAWKNLDADYYGMFHYRRYLTFSETTEPYSSPSDPDFPVRSFPTIQAGVEKIGLDTELMREAIESSDIIVPLKDDVRRYGKETSIYDQYAAAHRIEDLDDTLTYIKSTHPEIGAFASVLHQPTGYFFNMFIMSRNLFFRYCDFMFDTLTHFEATHDISDYNSDQYRVIGYLAERLTNVFIQYVQSLDTFRVREVPTAYFEHTEPKQAILPASTRNNVAVVLVADNNYAPYVSTLVHSIAEHANADFTYDINVLTRDISHENMLLLKSEFFPFANLSLRFVDMNPYADRFENLYVPEPFTVETYFRLFILDVMAAYDKVLYLDDDMIVKRDIAELFFTDITGYYAAAVRDIDFSGVYASNNFPSEDTVEPGRQQYAKEILRLDQPFTYFQAGVMVLNLAEIRKDISVDEMVNLANSRSFQYLDQDVLNMLFQGHTKLIDMRWNVLYDWNHWRLQNIIRKAPIRYYDEYMASRRNPYIVHYGGSLKPWHQVDCDYAKDFWRIARKSAYYESILWQLFDWHQHKANSETQAALQSMRNEMILRTRPRAILSTSARSILQKTAPVGTFRRRLISALFRHARERRR